MSLFQELKRRNVFRVAIAYAVVAWLVLQVADVVLNNIEAPDWIFQVLMLLFALGLPLVLMFAWVYEMTPEGLKRESEIDRTQSITPHTGRKLDRVISVVLALAVVYLLIDKLVLQRGSEPPAVPTNTTEVSGSATAAETPATGSITDGVESGALSIAVLPFVNMSADADNEYFSDGISEELLNVLVKVKTLHVASRTSTFAYKGKELPVTQIASELKVDNVVEGSVRKAGNRVRITAQLIDARNDRHLWSETYERELDDIFEIQEEISNAIVDALKIALNVNEAQAMERAQRPTDNLEAYEVYLQGRHLWRLRGGPNVRAGIELFRKAVELDPQFAAAWESLAAATGSLSSWDRNLTTRDVLDEAHGYAVRALELDPTRAEARAIVAEYLGQHWQWADMMDEYRRVIADAPNSGMLHMWRGEVLLNLGYPDAALEELLTAYELDPALGVVSNVLLYVGTAAERFDLVEKHWQIAAELGLETAADRNVASMYIIRGDVDPVIRAFGWEDADIPLCIAAVRDPALRPQLKETLEVLDINSAEQINAIVGPIRALDLCYTMVGQDEKAIDMLDTFIRNETWYGVSAYWKPGEGTRRLRQNPRFKALMHEMGLVDYWRENGWPDWCRADGENDFACD